jgi:hypothetical protein
MFNVILWPVRDILFVDTNPPMTMNTSYLRLLSTWQSGDVNFYPLPNLLIVRLESSFAFAL